MSRANNAAQFARESSGEGHLAERRGKLRLEQPWRNESRFYRSRSRRGFGRGANRAGRAQKVVVDVLDLPANLAPIEFRKDGGSGIGTEFAGQFFVFQNLDDAAA